MAGGTGLGAGFEGSHVVRSEVQAHHPIEESGGFTGRKAQVRFGQLTTRAQASQGQRRIGAGSDDQMQLRRQMVEQKGESIVDRLSRDEVIIVENEGKSFRHSGNLVDQSRQERLDCKWLGGLRGRDDRLADVLVDGKICQSISPFFSFRNSQTMNIPTTVMEKPSSMK